MREIKFRVFDKGYKDDLNKRPAKMRYFTLPEYAFDQDGEMGRQDIDLDSMPLMQYTGLKDKNGKEIFEGDIVKMDEFRGQVEFDEAEFMVSFGEKIDGQTYWALKDCYELEVIGNIYESPKAL